MKSFFQSIFFGPLFLDQQNFLIPTFGSWLPLASSTFYHLLWILYYGASQFIFLFGVWSVVFLKCVGVFQKAKQKFPNTDIYLAIDLTNCFFSLCLIFNVNLVCINNNKKELKGCKIIKKKTWRPNKQKIIIIFEAFSFAAPNLRKLATGHCFFYFGNKYQWFDPMVFQ